MHRFPTVLTMWTSVYETERGKLRQCSTNRKSERWDEGGGECKREGNDGVHVRGNVLVHADSM